MAALLSAFLLLSCAGANHQTNPPVQNAEPFQNAEISQKSDSAQVQAPIPEDDFFMQNARLFEASQVELPSAESYLDAANRDDADAQFILSMMYRLNIGSVEHIVDGKQSKNKADLNKEMHRWSLKALENGNVLGDYAHAHSLNLEFGESDVGLYEKSFKWLEDAAKAGYADAEFVLGILYYNIDKAKGQELIARAAVQGLPVAQFYVGMFYELGMGTSINKAKAMEWFNKAADAKNPDAEFVLALKYLDGIDVEKDAEKAEKYRSDGEKYHAWNLLMNKMHKGDFKLVCKFNYDEVEMGGEYDDDCGGDGDYYDPELSDAENERRRFEFAAQERAVGSINYAVDYDIAWKWLEQVTSVEAHTNARLLKIQVCSLSGCRCGDEMEYEKRLDKTKNEIEKLYSEDSSSAIAQYTLGSYYHHKALDDDYSCSDCSDEKKKEKNGYAQKAYDLYVSAGNAGLERANIALGDVYRDYDMPSLITYLGIEEDWEKASEYYSKGNHSQYAGESAYFAAEREIAQEHVENAIKLYEMAGDEKYQDAYLMLGKLYKNGKRVSKDDEKAIKYFTKYTEEYEFSSKLGDAALALSDIYAGKKDQDNTMKYCKMATEAMFISYLINGRELARCNALIQTLPKMSQLKTALEHEIEQESGKKLKEFFVYNSVVKPCEKIEKQGMEYSESTRQCNEIAHPLYEDSIKKAIRGITALVIAEKGTADIELIENTYYYIAMYLGRKDDFMTWLKNNSPNPDAIDDLYLVDRTVRKKIFYVWYLRQIPYAAKDVFENKMTDKSWDSYLKEADKAIAKNEKLKTAFGLDLVQYIDKF